MNPLATRMAEIEPFHVMAILARARALEAQGRSIVHMEIGEPDFPTATPIVEAGIAALRAGQTHYTPALGLPTLRAAIAASYPDEARPDPARVVVTPGSSGALTLVFGVLINPGDEVLMADPGYPCNRHFVRLFGGRATLVPVDATTSYQLTAALIRQYWTSATRAVLVSSPSNPTGTLVPDSEMAEMVRTVHELGGVLIVDEIYHGLTYGVPARSVLHHSADVFVVNSFSKYYGMTGWRVGWLVAPADYVEAIDRLAQNIFLAASTPAQHAALAAFRPEVLTELGSGGATSSTRVATIFCRHCVHLTSISRSRRKAHFTCMQIQAGWPPTATTLRSACWKRRAWRSHPGGISVCMRRSGMCAFPMPIRERSWKKACAGLRHSSADQHPESGPMLLKNQAPMNWHAPCYLIR